jgi:hypothetical protein
MRDLEEGCRPDVHTNNHAVVGPPADRQDNDWKLGMRTGP